MYLTGEVAPSPLQDLSEDFSLRTKSHKDPDAETALTKLGMSHRP